MKKIAILITLLIVLLGTSIVYAMEITTYTGTTTGTNIANIYNFTTYRTGDITVHITFPLNNHGIYQLNVLEIYPNQTYICWKTLDARWNRALTGDITCSMLAQSAGNYEVQFLSNRKVNFTLEILAETNK